MGRGAVTSKHFGEVNTSGRGKCPGNLLSSQRKVQGSEEHPGVEEEENNPKLCSFRASRQPLTSLFNKEELQRS